MIGKLLTWVLDIVPWWGYVAAGALVVTLLTGYHLTAVSQARKAGIAQDKARSDIVIANMIDEHSRAVGAADARADAASSMLEKVKQGAQDALRTANAATAKIRAAFAAVSGERDKLRDDLTRAIVTGGVQASDDSTQACRDRAERAGLVLQEALRASAVCAGDATDEAARGRALYEAWPVTP